MALWDALGKFTRYDEARMGIVPQVGYTCKTATPPPRTVRWLFAVFSSLQMDGMALARDTRISIRLDLYDYQERLLDLSSTVCVGCGCFALHPGGPKNPRR